MRWVKELVDRALGEGFGYHDLEFVWQESNDLDALTQAQIAQVYLAAGVLTPQEVRASLGLGNDQKGGAISAVPLPKGGAANAGRPFGKYSDDQPRDYHGRWTSGDDGAGGRGVNDIMTVSAPAEAPASPPKKNVGAQVACVEDLCIGEGIVGASVIESLITGLGVSGVDVASKEHDPSNPPIPGAVPGDPTAGPTEQWDKGGGLAEAEKDFDALQPKDVKTYPDGMKVGTLPDGRTVKLRPRSGRQSEDGPPTIEIENDGYLRGARKIKVRYKNGKL